MDDYDRYLEYLEYQKHYSHYTVDNYKEDLDDYFAYLNREEISYLDIEYSDIRLYLMYLKEEKKEKASTIGRHLSALRSFYRYLASQGKVDSNLFLLISAPKKEKNLPRYFEYNELEELFQVPDLTTPLGQRDRLILELLYATGMRVGELVEINVNDLDRSQRQILVRTGKGNKQRMVLYGEYAAEILDLYLKEGYQELRKGEEKALILNNQGRRITTRGVRYLLSNLIKKTSLHKNISPHMIRHSFATHLLNEGCDIMSVQELLGHASISSTQIYTHVTTDHLKEVYRNAFPRAKK